MATVLVVGAGGREHALALSLSRSTLVNQVLVVPGNGGTLTARIQSLPILASDTTGIQELVRDRAVDLVVVGPEEPLANGLADTLRDAGVSVFGPSKKAARIEASKAFSKEFMKKHNIPTAEFANFTNVDEAIAYVKEVKYDVVIKASGLAAGKGVVLPQSKEEAIDCLNSIMKNKAFGVAGEEVVIEEYLVGEEISCMAFTDGTFIVPLPAAQDHKRVFNGDKGPNTGGMGAYAPAPIGKPFILEQIKNRVLQRAVDAMRVEGFPFVGVLYAGMMVTSKGVFTIEFNCRLGDPETQVLLALLQTDLYAICSACANGSLRSLPVEFAPPGLFAVTVVAVSEGYPGKYPLNLPISGINEAEAVSSNITVHHAGTKIVEGKGLVTSGGRVLSVTAIGSSIENAVQLAYEGIAHIKFDGIHYRTDIAHRALQERAPRFLRIGVLGSTRGSSLQALLDGIKFGTVPNVSVEIIVSNKEDAGILQRAKENGIKSQYVNCKGRAREVADAEISDIFASHNVDLILLIGYMRILSSVFVDRWRNCVFNVHPSLLPSFAGGMDLQVHEAVIAAKATISGCTVHVVDEGVDTGAIVIQKQVLVDADETALSLKSKVQALEGIAFIEAIEMFRAVPLPFFIVSSSATVPLPVEIVSNGVDKQSCDSSIVNSSSVFHQTYTVQQIVDFAVTCTESAADVELFDIMISSVSDSFEQLVLIGESKLGLIHAKGKILSFQLKEGGFPATLTHYLAALGRYQLLKSCLRHDIVCNWKSIAIGETIASPKTIAKSNGYIECVKILDNSRTSGDIAKVCLIL